MTATLSSDPDVCVCCLQRPAAPGSAVCLNCHAALWPN